MSPKGFENLNDFIARMIYLLNIVGKSNDVLFRKGFRKNLIESLEEALPRLHELTKQEDIRNPEESKRMTIAGLAGIQLELKLESFQQSLVDFDNEGGIENLEIALSKGGTILSSLAGAIPGFGSFAQELVEFILNELKTRYKRRK